MQRPDTDRDVTGPEKRTPTQPPMPSSTEIQPVTGVNIVDGLPRNGTRRHLLDRQPHLWRRARGTSTAPSRRQLSTGEGLDGKVGVTSLSLPSLLSTLRAHVGVSNTSRPRPVLYLGKQQALPVHPPVPSLPRSFSGSTLRPGPPTRPGTGTLWGREVEDERQSTVGRLKEDVNHNWSEGDV